MSEWIEKEEVLKQIDCWFTTGEYKYSNATHYLDKRISSIKPKESEWVSVKDRMPEPNTVVLVHYADGRICTADYIDEYLGFVTSSTITHWMPIPEKPESEDDAE